VVVNDRLDVPGDVTTPEEYQPAAPMAGDDGLWEACQTLNGSWGYDRDNLNWKSPEMIVRMLVDGVSKGGNLLLNVGPNARGRLEPRAVPVLEAIGKWMTLHGRSIYGAGPSEFVPPADCRFTQRDDRLYVHLFAWPFGHLHLRGLAGKVRYAQLLHDGSEIRMQVIDPHGQAQNTKLGGVGEGTLTLTLPIQRPAVAVPVIELFLRQVR
jgi:alpha-L-fucosidase